MQHTIEQKEKSGIKFSPLISGIHPDVSYILHHFNAPLNIFDHRHKRFLYVNKRFTQLAGLSAEACYDQNLEDFGSWIDVGDFSMLQNEIGKRLYEAYREYVRDNSEQLTYLINFRLKEKGSGNAPTIVLAKCSVVEWNANHTPAITLNLLTDITHYKHNHKTILSIKMFEKHAGHWKTMLKEEFLRVPEMLGGREREIMAEMLKDKSAAKIAEEKDMSFHTVRSHWRNVLQKTNCHTQKELKHRAHLEGWV